MQQHWWYESDEHRDGLRCNLWFLSSRRIFKGFLGTYVFCMGDGRCYDRSAGPVWAMVRWPAERHNDVDCTQRRRMSKTHGRAIPLVCTRLVRSGKLKDAEVMDEFNHTQTSVNPWQTKMHDW